MNILPAELVAKIAEDERLVNTKLRELYTTAPRKHDVEIVRHAYICAAMALEEAASKLPQRHILLVGNMRVGDPVKNPAVKELRAAARALREAAEEGREP